MRTSTKIALALLALAPLAVMGVVASSALADARESAVEVDWAEQAETDGEAFDQVEAAR